MNTKDDFYDTVSNVSAFYISFKSNIVKRHQEYRVYDEIGVITSVGGSLGLFIGFSFFEMICRLVDRFLENDNYTTG